MKKEYRIVRETNGVKEYYVLDGKFNPDKFRAKTYSKTTAQKVRNMLALTFSGQMVYIELV